MIYIDLPADLNLEDDEGRNIARLGDAVAQDTVTPGAVLVAGAPRAWSWAVVEDVDSGFVYFRQISARRPRGEVLCQTAPAVSLISQRVASTELVSTELVSTELVRAGAAPRNNGGSLAERTGR